MYYLEYDEPFIEVLPHEAKEITFKAYCLDFDYQEAPMNDAIGIQIRKELDDLNLTLRQIRDLLQRIADGAPRP